MIIDLIHNKIVADTISSGFERSFENVLVPALKVRYANREITAVQMYEDYIADNFKRNGYWYYPLTIAFADGHSTQWVRWAVNEKDFVGGVPYNYVGNGDIGFELVEAPAGFEDRLAGRARFCEDGLIKVRVEAIGADSIKLSGKYSQTFIDELSRQITVAIGTAMSVEGLSDSTLALSLVFAPGTFMEHISENVTYRRLTLSDKSSAPRDFWIKWTRLDGAVAYSVASHVTGDTILFELGEDVTQKVREKEYRYLLTSGMDKYHGAMSRKNVTEWREIIKRAIRRGEIEKIELEIELSPETKALEEKLADVLGIAGAPVGDAVEVTDSAAANDNGEFERAIQKMREITLGTAEDESESKEDNSDAAEAEESVEAPVEEIAEEAVEEVEEAVAVSEAVVFDSESDDSDDYDSSADQGQVELFDEEEDEEDDEDEDRDELDEFYAEDEKLEISEGAVASNDSEAEELEAITRLAMESLKEVNAKKAEEETNADFEDIVDEEALDDENDEEVLEELRALDPDDEVEEEPADENPVEESIVEKVVVEEVTAVETPVAEAFVEEPASESVLVEELPAEAVTIEEAPVEEASVEEAPVESVPEISVELPESVISAEREEDIRAEVETKIRLEYESRARIAAEQEAARLRREQELQRAKSEKLLSEALQEQTRLRFEYEKLRQETLRMNAERDKQDAIRRAEEERLRAQIEAQLRQEARERERLAEAARLAIAEQHRLEEEHARMEQERLEEARRAEEEKLRKMEEERIAAERAAEAERIRLEQEEARRAAAAAAASANDGQTYVTKTVKFIFRRSVDPNITTRIHEIIKATIDYYGKDKIFMKIRASIPDNQTVCLEFLQMPSGEMELLSNIIKILGNSGLGIAKAIVE